MGLSQPRSVSIWSLLLWGIGFLDKIIITIDSGPGVNLLHDCCPNVERDDKRAVKINLISRDKEMTFWSVRSDTAVSLHGWRLSPFLGSQWMLIAKLWNFSMICSPVFKQRNISGGKQTGNKTDLSNFALLQDKIEKFQMKGSKLSVVRVRAAPFHTTNCWMHWIRVSWRRRIILCQGKNLWPLTEESGCVVSIKKWLHGVHLWPTIQCLIHRIQGSWTNSKIVTKKYRWNVRTHNRWSSISACLSNDDLAKVMEGFFVAPILWVGNRPLSEDNRTKTTGIEASSRQAFLSGERSTFPQFWLIRTNFPLVLCDEGFFDLT